MELKLPTYFKGALDHLKKLKVTQHEDVQPTNSQMELFNRIFANEINIYNHIRQKFEKHKLELEQDGISVNTTAKWQP